MNQDESSLLQGLRSGDPASFEEVVRKHGGRLLAVAARILGSEDEAPDVVQEAFISAWRGIAAFEGSSRLSTWLHRIVVNACLARLRAAPVKSEVSLADEEQGVRLAFAGQPSAWFDPGVDLEKRVAMRHAIQRALRLIPEELRSVLLLRDVEGLTSREVADHLGLPDTTVRQRLHRARRAMAELLRPELCTADQLTCGGQLDLLLDYIDGLLSAEMQPQVQNHLDTCAMCASLLGTYRATIAIPRAIAELTAVEDVAGAWVTETVARAMRPASRVVDL